MACSRVKSMSTSKIEVSIRCACGRSLIAHQGNAGTTISCDCGQDVVMPRLSKLRQLSGADAYATNPGDLIRSAVAKGQSPGSDACLSCGSSSAPLYRCFAQCESPVQRQRSSRPSGDIGSALIKLVGFFVMPISIVVKRRESQGIVCGNEVRVDFSIRVCKSCRTNRGDPTKPHVLKKLLIRLREYRDLVDYYPDTQFHVIDIDYSPKECPTPLTNHS